MTTAATHAAHTLAGTPAATAVCTHDGEPLIATFAFTGAEFLCLGCGRLYGFIEPAAEPTSPALDERLATLTSDWRRNAAQHLLRARMADQATPADRLQHNAAVLWLAARTGRRAFANLAIPTG